MCHQSWLENCCLWHYSLATLFILEITLVASSIWSAVHSVSCTTFPRADLSFNPHIGDSQRMCIAKYPKCNLETNENRQTTFFSLLGHDDRCTARIHHLWSPAKNGRYLERKRWDIWVFLCVFSRPWLERYIWFIQGPPKLTMSWVVTGVYKRCSRIQSEPEKTTERSQHPR